MLLTLHGRASSFEKKANSSRRIAISPRTLVIAAGSVGILGLNLNSCSTERRQSVSFPVRTEPKLGAFQQKLFETAIKYKEVCEELQDHHNENRMPPPTFDPNPADIIVDFPRQNVPFSLRATHRVKSACSALSEIKREFNDELRTLQRLLDADPNNALIKK